MSVSIDTNIFVYAFDERDPAKQKQASQLLEQLTLSGGKVAGQILTEFLNVSYKKKLFDPALARTAVATLGAELDVIEQSTTIRLQASDLASRHALQFYDAVLCATLISAQVSVLLSEGMSDGSTYSGLLILNPFNPANSARIAAALI